MGSAEQIRARAELEIAVAAIRSGEASFADGVRRILSLRSALCAPAFDADFMVLTAVDTQSDHLPNAYAKSIASDAWLAQCAAEERELQERSGPDVLAACVRLLVTYAGEE